MNCVGSLECLLFCDELNSRSSSSSFTNFIKPQLFELFFIKYNLIFDRNSSFLYTEERKRREPVGAVCEAEVLYSPDSIVGINPLAFLLHFRISGSRITPF